MLASAPQSRPGFIEPRGLAHHQLGRAHRGIGLGDRKLDALVLADRPAEHHALVGVVGRLLDEPFGVADAFRRRSGCARRSCRRGCSGSPCLPRRSGSRPAPCMLSKNTSVVEWFIMVRIGRMVRPLPSRLAHVDDEHRQAVGALRRLFLRRGAREQQHQVGMFGAAGPDLLAVDDVVVAVALGGGLQRGGVGAAGRLGDAEGLQAQFAGGDAAAGTASSAPRCRAAAACPWCTSARGRRRRCSPRAGLPRGSRLPRDELQARAAIFLRDQHRRDSRPGSALARTRSGRPSRDRACASIRRESARRAWRRRRGCRQ